MANDDQYHGKCVSLNVSDFSNSSEKSAPKVELKFPDEKLEQANEKIVIKEPLLKCRYLVTLMVFLINFQINCYRLNTSISIVAMVNNTAISTSDAANISSLSCPSNVLEVEMNSKHKNGLFASVPFVLQTFLALLVSWISGWLNKHKYAGVDKVRKGCNFLFCVGYSLCLLGIYAAGCDKSTSAPFSILAMGSVGLSFAGCMIAAIDMSPTFAGTIMGVSSIISSLSGFIMPILVGVLTNDEQTLEQWNKVFFISIGVTMTSGIIFSLFGSAEVQDWNFPVLKEFEKGDEKNNKEKMTSGNSSDFKKSTTHL
ncbi:putative inorganic phosphate cotransporter like protein [Argiope bruennichi]|uniref:Putative inorganic phosphate cotransporter like protein n=1 Tax=Argiope bruennichi TaxID=94029 RepID=A0A8T0FFM5_ARGBR|nr:putative inorganic phosphate cotransporter like protein [Argiope bruennichi]